MQSRPKDDSVTGFHSAPLKLLNKLDALTGAKVAGVQKPV